MYNQYEQYAVLTSIRPKWCELIANGKKTVELRKTRPRRKPPFKGYIYCTQPKYPHEDFIFIDAGTENAIAFYAGGKVIGEYVCNRIDTIVIGNSFEEHPDLQKHTCLSEFQMNEYLNGAVGYGWHISDLVIYDKPKELSDFLKPCPHGDVSCFLCDKSGYNEDMHIDCFNKLTRPPQSWCYVEELR